MKVALVSRALAPHHGHGGLERHVAALRKYLTLAGCDVTVVTTPIPTEDPGVITESYRTIPWPCAKGFVVLDRNSNYLIWSLRAARRVLSDVGPDIVQADGGAAFGLAWYREESSPPLVLHPHGMEEFKAPIGKRLAYWPLRRAIRFAACRAERVLVPDVSMREDVSGYLGVDDARLAVLPNAIDLEDVDSDKVGMNSLRFGSMASERVLLSVGRLEANKGFTILARALGAIKERLPERWRWVLVGEGPERVVIEREVVAQGIGPHTTLMGSIGDAELSGLYERADLFVHPTLYEGSSMVTLEAMAHRKPVVATRVGGIPDKVVDGATGILVPPADVEALASAIEVAMTMPVELANWGREGRRLAEKLFSWKTRIDDLVALYEEILAAHESSGRLA